MDYKQKLKQFVYAFLITFKVLSLVFFYLIPETAFVSALNKEDIYNLHNQSRQTVGIAKLSYSPILEKSALLKAKDMFDNDYFEHDSPNGKQWESFFDKVNYDYSYAGENLAIDFSSSEKLHQKWLDSPLHKKNILNANFTEVGIGVLKGEYKGYTTIVVVVHFGKPAGVSLGVESINSSTNIQTSYLSKFNADSVKGLINLGYLGAASLVFGYASFKTVEILKAKQFKQKAYSLLRSYSLLTIIVVLIIIG